MKNSLIADQCWSFKVIKWFPWLCEWNCFVLFNFINEIVRSKVNSELLPFQTLSPDELLSIFTTLLLVNGSNYWPKLPVMEQRGGVSLLVFFPLMSQRFTSWCLTEPDSDKKRSLSERYTNPFTVKHTYTSGSSRQKNPVVCVVRLQLNTTQQANTIGVSVLPVPPGVWT